MSTHPASPLDYSAANYAADLSCVVAVSSYWVADLSRYGGIVCNNGDINLNCNKNISKRQSPDRVGSLPDNCSVGYLPNNSNIGTAGPSLQSFTAFIPSSLHARLATTYSDSFGRMPTDELDRLPNSDASRMSGGGVYRVPTTEFGKVLTSDIAGRPTINESGNYPTDDLYRHSSIEIGKQPSSDLGSQPSSEDGRQPSNEVSRQPSNEVGRQPRSDMVRLVSDARWAQLKARSRQRVTTTESEEFPGMSKRKRKLSACAKCGYVTGNQTTLQHHAARHGSDNHTRRCSRRCSRSSSSVPLGNSLRLANTRDNAQSWGR